MTKGLKMKNILLKTIFFIFVLFLFSSCSNNDNVTKEECESLGLKYTKEKVLNLRTGEYETRVHCKQN